jgi:hypothetical protein
MFMTWNTMAFSVNILNYSVYNRLSFARYYAVPIAGVKRERSTNRWVTTNERKLEFILLPTWLTSAHVDTK